MRGRWAAIRSLVLPYGAKPGQPRIIVNVNPVPPELVTYYQSAPQGTNPETVVGLTINYDGQNPEDYAYQGMVIDSSNPKITSLVVGASVAGTVNEASRFALNPGMVLGNARFQQFFEECILLLTSATGSTTVAATQALADAFHRWSLNMLGTMGWGPGNVITDCYLTRKAPFWMEFGNRLDLRSFGLLTDTMFGVRLDGEVNPRLLIRTDGQVRWGGGTAGTDVGLFRRSANELSTDGDFSLSALGAGILIKEGANCTLGEATLAAGTVTIANTNVTANCRIFVNRRTSGGALGHLSTTINAGVSFTVTSSSATETSTIDWLILYPA